MKLTKQLLNFISISNDYCKLLEEDLTKYSKQKLLRSLNQILPEIYTSFLKIEKYNKRFDNENETYITEVDYNLVYNSLIEKIGDSSDYLDIVDPMMFKYQEPVANNIAENLADIYQDLKNFLIPFEMNINDDVMHEAVAECQIHFKEYWGIRLLSSLKAVHILVHSA